MPAFDVDALRAEFPALAREQDGRPVAFLDGPGGTQVPQRVIDAVVGYYRDTNANAGGAFATSERQRRDGRRGARRGRRLPRGRESPDEIKFGYNMTTLTLHIGRSIGATLEPGDEIVVTTLDHEANVSTWRAMAADRGVTVRTVDIRRRRRHARPRGPRVEARAADEARRGRLRQQRGRHDQPGPRDRRPRARGRRADLRRRRRLRAARPDRRPRRSTPTSSSARAYKWFGPHLGALYGKAEVLDRLPAYKVRPAHDRFETGTPSFESIAGTLAATDYLRDVGRSYGDVAGAPGAASGSERRRELVAGDGRDRRLRAGARRPG